MSITCTRIDVNRLPDVTAAQLLVANATNRLAAVGMTGDIAIDDDGLTAIGASKVLSAMMDESTIRYAAVEISSAELLLLFTTPKALVATPGAGKVLEFISLQLALDFATTAYTVAACTDLQVKYTNGAGVAVSTIEGVAGGFIASAADALRLFEKLELSVEPAVNAALVLTLAGGNPAGGGDSPIHAKVAYRVLPTGL